MALRFNPPPNWPAPPEGFEPPAGWQPDPAWGPAPEGWQIWVDDSAPSSGSASSAPGTASGADPAWAPTQAVSTAPTAQMGTGAPVADPTGTSASAPSGDYAGQAAGAGGLEGRGEGGQIRLEYAQSILLYRFLLFSIVCTHSCFAASLTCAGGPLSWAHLNASKRTRRSHPNSAGYSRGPVKETESAKNSECCAQ